MWPLQTDLVMHIIVQYLRLQVGGGESASNMAVVASIRVHVVITLPSGPISSKPVLQV